MNTRKIKKTLLLTGLLAGSLFVTTGCTPGYSWDERNQRIARNQNYEMLQSVDDFDYIMMLQPASRLTAWNVQ